MKTTQKTQKKYGFPKNYKSELAVDTPTHFRVFLRFFIFFLTWQNPINLRQYLLSDFYEVKCVLF